MITAALIDRREPSWVQALTFGNVPVSVTELDAGDTWITTDDNYLLMVERKTSDDLLGTIHDERLYPQMTKLVQRRLDQEASGEKITNYPYLVITGKFSRNANDMIVTDRGETGWNWNSIQGVLLDVQEMGVFVVMADDYEQCLIRLGNRKRKTTHWVLPPRVPAFVGPQIGLLASIPGIGIETAQKILDWSTTPAFALCGLTDLTLEAPFGTALRKKVRSTLGLRDNEQIEVWINKNGDEVLAIGEKHVQASS
jgi:hypothetical protein